MTAQTRPVDELIVGAGPIPETRGGWVWLVAGSVAPERDALERLLDVLAASPPLPSPALLAGKVVLPDGAPEPAAFPVPRVVEDRDLTVAAVERRVFPIRIALPGSLLVQGRAVGAFGLPSGHAPAETLVWTARVLKRDLGLFVPASVAVSESVEGRRELGAWARLLLGGSLRAREKPLLAFRVAEALAERTPARG